MEVTAPTDPGVADGYRQAELWTNDLLGDGLERVADEDPERIAIIDNNGTYNYGELRRRVEIAVGRFRRSGITEGQAIVIVAPNLVESVVAIHAAVRANGVAVVLDRRCGALDVANAVESSVARLIVVPAGLAASLTDGLDGISLIEMETLHDGAPEPRWAEPDPAKARFVVFTSGTTKRAKGVIHSLESMGAAARNLASVFGLTAEDRPFLSSPIGTITGVAQVWASTQGAGLVLEDRFDASRSLDRIESHRATVIGGAPVILELLFDEYDRRGLNTSSLQRIALGGTMIPRSVLEVAIDRFGIQPVRVYGSSEVPVHCASQPSDTKAQRLGDDGHPLPGAECRLGDAFDGGHELLVRGPNMFLGYLHDDDNEGAFVDGWFRTGDLVEYNGDRVRVLGRLKDVVARKGLKVSLAEVDDAAEGIGGAMEVAAFGVADDDTGERVALAVHLADRATMDYDTVVAALAERGLARGKLPEEIVIWHDPLPRNPSGKIVRADVANGSIGRPRSVAPRLNTVPDA